MKKDFLSFMQKGFIILVSFFILSMSAVSHALPLSIIPKAGTTLPTSVNQGSTVTAYYTVYNLTASQRNGNFVKYLPPNVSQVNTGGTYGDTCSSTFSLAPNAQSGYSCTLQLTISGAVSSIDTSPSNHLFVCFPGGKTCAGTNYPLNVTQSSEKILTSIAITPTSTTIGIAGTQQYTAIGTYSDSSTTNITNTAIWNSSVPSYATISSTGLATGVAAGTTDITATEDSIVSNTATLAVETPVTVSLTTPSNLSTGVSVSTPIVITFSGAVEPSTVTNSTFEVGTTAGGSDISGNIAMSAGNTVATFTPTSSLSFDSTVYVTVTSGILDAEGVPITVNSFIFATQLGYLIFVSTATSAGDLSGITGADTICQSDGQCPSGTTCQAMLVGTNGGYTREAAPTPTNWVLQASTPYINTSNQLIGTTTSNAIFGFPFAQAVYTTSYGIWTGLNTNWTSSSFNCGNWENTVTDGEIGESSQTDSSAISENDIVCMASTIHLYCVQQP